MTKSNFQPGRGRAFRRHHAGRLLARARQITRLNFVERASPDDRERQCDAMARRIRDHLAGCSCWMCGNPRRHFGDKTIQERRAAESECFDRLSLDLPRI